MQRRGAILRVGALAAIYAAAALLTQIDLQSRGFGNAGFALANFVERACGGAVDACPPAIFAGPDTPLLASHLARRGALGSPLDAYPNPYAPEVATEMRRAHARLLLGAPRVFLAAVARTWREQIGARRLLSASPEDVNLALVQRPGWRELAWVAESLAAAVAASAPFVLLLTPLLPVLSRDDLGRQIALCAVAAWTASELFSTPVVFANAWPPDAGRMRLHYEPQALFLSLLALDGAIRRVRAARARAG